MTKTRAKSSGKPDCSIRFDWFLEMFSFLLSNTSLQLFDSPLQGISILSQYGNRLHVSTLIAPSHQVVDMLPELLG